MRRNEALNSGWKFRPDFQEDYLAKESPLDGFVPAELPHTNHILPYNQFDEKDFQFVSSYARDLDISELDRGHRLILRFGGVMTVADVYLNGKHLMKHEGGFTPFSVEITEEVLFGESNRLFVRVDSREIPDVPPFGNIVDYLCYGGIYREVSLLVRPSPYIKNLFVKTFDSPNLSASEMLFDLMTVMSETEERDYAVDVDIVRDGVPVFSDSFSGRFVSSIPYSKIITGIERWTLDRPVLYDVSVRVAANGEEVDHSSTRFGFRTVRFTPEGFILNNQKIKLIGLDRHQSWPYVGFAMPKRVQERDAEILKYELGCNIVRTSHYMQSDHFIRRCDEIGLLVFEEIPGWQYIGNEHFKELSYQNLTDMILGHYNHPSVCLWGVRINESPDDDEFYRETNRIAHELDDSRQTGGVRNFKGSHLLEDVYTYNDFSHVGDNPGLIRPIQATKAHVPYLVTEYNGHVFPTKKFDSEGKRLEHALRHLAVQDANFAHEDASGAIGWCMSDYNTHIEFGSGDRICYHGVTDMFRIPKYAAAVYASQQTKTPVLVVASNMTMGDYPEAKIPATVIFTNCDYVKVYKNGTFIDTFYSAWDRYPNIPYAPVIVDDYIGNQIRDHEGYSPRVAARIKKVLLSYTRHGMNLPLADRLRVANLMAVHKLRMEDAMTLFGKYVGDWGKEGAQYVFEGYIDDKLVRTVTKGSTRKTLLTAVADDAFLKPEETYEATRIVIRMVDEFGNDFPYAGNVIDVETSPELAVIGPSRLALLGGSVGVYVRTTGSKGTGTVRIASEGQTTLEVSIEIR